MYGNLKPHRYTVDVQRGDGPNAGQVTTVEVLHRGDPDHALTRETILRGAFDQMFRRAGSPREGFACAVLDGTFQYHGRVGQEAEPAAAAA